MIFWSGRPHSAPRSPRSGSPARSSVSRLERYGGFTQVLDRDPDGVTRFDPTSLDDAPREHYFARGEWPAGRGGVIGEPGKRLEGMSHHVRAGADAELGINEGQKEAVKTILSSKDRVIGVQDYAGAGKTTMLKRLRVLAESRDYRTVGLPRTPIRGPLTAGAFLPAACRRGGGGRHAGTAAREAVGSGAPVRCPRCRRADAGWNDKMRLSCNLRSIYFIRDWLRAMMPAGGSAVPMAACGFLEARFDDGA